MDIKKFNKYFFKFGIFALIALVLIGAGMVAAGHTLLEPKKGLGARLTNEILQTPFARAVIGEFKISPAAITADPSAAVANVGLVAQAFGLAGATPPNTDGAKLLLGTEHAGVLGWSTQLGGLQDLVVPDLKALQVVVADADSIKQMMLAGGIIAGIFGLGFVGGVSYWTYLNKDRVANTKTIILLVLLFSFFIITITTTALVISKNDAYAALTWTTLALGSALLWSFPIMNAKIAVQ